MTCCFLQMNTTQGHDHLFATTTKMTLQFIKYQQQKKISKKIHCPNTQAHFILKITFQILKHSTIQWP